MAAGSLSVFSPLGIFFFFQNLTPSNTPEYKKVRGPLASAMGRQWKKGEKWS